MYDRAKIVDTNFIKNVLENTLPTIPHFPTPESVGLTPEQLLDLFETQMMSRHLDILARVLKAQNQSFYTIGSSGHEGNAAIGMAFRHTDMAFLHYRSGGLVIQRAKHLPGSTPLYDLMLSLVASSEDPIAGGRHKVFGSLPLFIPPQTSTIASHLPKAVGAAFSIPRARALGSNFPTLLPSDSVIICSFGDASANHSTALGAFNTASWLSHQYIPLPLVFICEDNGIGISVHTPHNWIEVNFCNRPGIKYISCDGLNLLDTYQKSSQAATYARRFQRPVFLHVKLVRLLGHAGSDIESTYHSLAQIESREKQDPLLYSAALILRQQILNGQEIINLYEKIRERLSRIAEVAITRPKLTTIGEILTSLAPQFPELDCPLPPFAGQELREKIFGKDYSQLPRKVHMAKLINWALQDLMMQYPQTVVLGEDVAKKGGVYHLTTGLEEKFGNKRVFNTLLDEQTILGAAIGLAHNGFLPLPEIQFLAYYHNAQDQIRGEAATLSFFSQGQFTNPMVVRIAGLPYQKGFGGHFHNDNSIAALRDVPGLIIAIPAHGQDAVLMLRTCLQQAYQQKRVVIFIEPIALYMTKDLHQSGDNLWSFSYPPLEESLDLGEVGVYGHQDKNHSPPLSIITYGNGLYYSLQAEKILREKHHLNPRIIDLRWMAPLPLANLQLQIANSENILIVDECRKTGSVSEGIASFLAQAHSQGNLKQLKKIKVLAAEDCFIPLGVAAASGLPSRDDIVSASLTMMD